MEFQQRLPMITIASFVALSIAMLVYRDEVSTAGMMTVTALMFVTCFSNAAHLLGPLNATRFALIAIFIGWMAEQVGVSTGWVFGEYEFTEVLGTRLGVVPVVIPVMWFSICYVCYVLANLIVWRSPIEGAKSWGVMVMQSFMAAMLVTSYDLGLDPYMVFVAKAWVMKKTDGWWFGETIHGFFGWLAVSFLVVIVFRLVTRNRVVKPAIPYGKGAALIPVVIYASWMGFLMVEGQPMETRTIAAFAMGIPLLTALFAYPLWRWDEKTGR